MGNRQKKKDSISDAIPKSNNSIPDYDGYFLFFWKDNSKKGINNLFLFSPKDQEKFELHYQIILRKKKDKKFKEKDIEHITLNPPQENFMVDLIEFNLFHKKKPKEKYEIIRKPVTIEYITENLLIEEDSKFIFFWKANKNPFRRSGEEVEYSPYDLEDQYILKLAYALYRVNPYYDKGEIRKPNEHFINLKSMMQICKADTYRQRPILRSISTEVENIVRVNRFFYLETQRIEYEPQINIMNQENIEIQNQAAFLELLVSEKDQIQEEINYTIYFDVIENIILKYEIKQNLSFFKNNEIIKMPYKDWVEKIEIEIRNLGILLDKKNSTVQYIDVLNESTNSCNFFKMISKMYTLEGFLFRKLNDYLRSLDKSGLNNLKYFYNSLLASFEYFSNLDPPKGINLNEDLIIYRGSKISEKEFNEYTNNNNENIVRIFNEFISTSRRKSRAYGFFKKNEDNVKSFLWEITIPKIFLQNERQHFAFIEDYSVFEGEEEVLIKSGSVILIEKIIPYQENGIIIKNKFIKKCILKSLEITKYLKTIKFDKGVESLELGGNQLGYNSYNMRQLSNGLKNNKNIKRLYLWNNDLGINSENIKELSNGIKDNESIKLLNLWGNNLGCNVDNIRELSEGLKINNNISELYLWNNELGLNSENMRELALGLKENKSIIILSLENNELGSNTNNIKYLIEGLEGNHTLQKLFLGENEINQDDKKLIEEKNFRFKIIY
jgi:hypothetical protein